MSNYGNQFGENPMGRSRDVVLSINEFCFLQNKTNGSIKSHVGPLTMTISAQEALVVFDEKTKKFTEVSDFERAKQLFVSAPEGWYVILKNPTSDNQYPEAAKANVSPASITIGKKVNIPGPVSFALYPGQMAKTVRGHRLRSNQYLLARVYDAEAAMANSKNATMVDAEGNAINDEAKEYFMGQLLVIKGTEVSFYVPPTGIEVIPCGGRGTEYVRDAVTLERLEYAILKDEDGEKRYVHGPAVVFPEPTETFIETPKGGVIFRALELSPISGIYIKVIADYEENEVKHPIGEELFITGNDQMIYYPRPEHAMIQYDGKYMHHAIAIPEGEGRYIMNRLTGEIKTIVGPKMYLPDPRTEVVVKRKLTAKECELFYPGNKEVLKYNDAIQEDKMLRAANKGLVTDSLTTALNCAYSTSNQDATLAIFEAGSNISRGNSYTKPRTITLDTKYDGVVGINVWTGYAVNVVSKTGKRDVVVGPTTRLLNYDETLEAMELSTGRPKTTDNLLRTAYLRVENNKVSDLVTVQTKDFVNVEIKVSYCVDFLEEYKSKWFSVENYVKFMCDRERSLLKREAKKYTIEEFYNKASDIVRNVVLDIQDTAGCEACEDDGSRKYFGRLFRENGMLVKDVEVLSVRVDRDVQAILDRHQEQMIEQALELTNATTKAENDKKLAAFEKQSYDLKQESRLYRAKLDKIYEEEKLANATAIDAAEDARKKAHAEAEKEIQALKDAIHDAELARTKKVDDARIALQKEQAAIDKEKEQAYADMIKSVMSSISPDLVAAMTSSANAEIMDSLAEHMSPYAIARGESVADVTTKLLRGTPMEEFLSGMNTVAKKK